MPAALRRRRRSSRAPAGRRPTSVSWNLREAAELRRFERQPRGGHAVGPEDRQLAIDDAQPLILLQQAVDARVARLAIGAGVIEEFDQRHVGLGRALPRACERRFDRGAIGGEHRRILRIAKRIDRVGQDLGVGEQSLRERSCC